MESWRIKNSIIRVGCLSLFVTALPLQANIFQFSESQLLALSKVNDDPAGQTLFSVTDDLLTYGVPAMGGDVGYIGLLIELGVASPSPEIWIGNSGADLTGIDTFELALSNDDDDIWSLRLFATEDDTDFAGTTTFSGSFVSLLPGESDLFVMDVKSLGPVDSMGFIVELEKDADVYHISATIPEPLTVSLLALGGLALLRRKSRQ